MSYVNCQTICINVNLNCLLQQVVDHLGQWDGLADQGPLPKGKKYLLEVGTSALPADLCLHSRMALLPGVGEVRQAF